MNDELWIINYELWIMKEVEIYTAEVGYVTIVITKEWYNDDMPHKRNNWNQDTCKTWFIQIQPLSILLYLYNSEFTKIYRYKSIAIWASIA